MPVTAPDLAVLAFERQCWVQAGAREATITEELGVTAVRHAQRLDRVIDRPAALEHDAQLVRRLQCRRGQEASAVRAGVEPVGRLMIQSGGWSAQGNWAHACLPVR